MEFYQIADTRMDEENSDEEVNAAALVEIADTAIYVDLVLENNYRS